MHGCVQVQRLSTYLLAYNIIAGLDIGRNGGRPGTISAVHHPDGTPDAIFIYGVLGEFEEFELVDVHIRNISIVWGHPRRDWALVGVEPLRPLECDFAASTHLCNCAGCWLVGSITGDIIAVSVKDREDVSTAKGNAIRSRAEVWVDVDIPARIAAEKASQILT